MTDEARRLSEGEVHRVLSRATELSVELGDGLTVEELKAVSAEAGIPSEALSAALRELSRSHPDDTADRGVGRREGTTIPVTVSDQELALLLKILDRLGHVRGKVSYDAGTFSWRSSEGHRIDLTTYPSETRVRVRPNTMPKAVHVAGGLTWAGALAYLATIFDPAGLAAMVGASVGLTSVGAALKLRATRLRESATRTLWGIAETIRLVSDDGDRD